MSMKLFSLLALSIAFSVSTSSPGVAAHQPSRVERAAACADFPARVQALFAKEFPKDPRTALSIATSQTTSTKVKVYNSSTGCLAEPIEGVTLNIPEYGNVDAAQAAVVYDLSDREGSRVRTYVLVQLADDSGKDAIATTTYLAFSLMVLPDDGSARVA